MSITRLEFEAEMDGDKGCTILIRLCGDLDVENFFASRTETQVRLLLEAMIRDAEKV